MFDGPTKLSPLRALATRRPLSLGKPGPPGTAGLEWVYLLDIAEHSAVSGLCRNRGQTGATTGATDAGSSAAVSAPGSGSHESGATR